MLESGLTFVEQKDNGSGDSDGRQVGVGAPVIARMDTPPVFGLSRGDKCAISAVGGRKEK